MNDPQPADSRGADVPSWIVTHPISTETMLAASRAVTAGDP